MKIFLYILLALKGVAFIYLFLSLLGQAPIWAFVILALGILELLPVIAIIFCIDNIEKLREENSMLSFRLKKLENATEIYKDDTVSAESYPELKYGDTAKASWECVKCGTVNKAETTHCSNCKAEYLSNINPTFYPTKKKKISRFVKFK